MTEWSRHLDRLRGPGARRARDGRPSKSLNALLARLPKRSTVVDLGCGESGDCSVARLRGYRAFGLDLFPPLHAGKHFIQANAKDLPLQSESVEGVISHAMVALLSPPERWEMYHEIARVLKPRGFLSLAVYPLADGFAVRDAIESDRIFECGLHQVAAGVYTKCAEPNCEEHPDPDSWEAILRGLKLIDPSPSFIETASRFVAWIVRGGSPSEAAKFANVTEASIREVIKGATDCGIFDVERGCLDLPWLNAFMEDKVSEGNIGLVLDVLAIRGEIERINDAEGLRYRARQTDVKGDQSQSNVRPFKKTQAA